MISIENVASFFDGMSCGQIAMQELGINYRNYFSSEINKDAIKLTNDNFKNTIQIGDINHVRPYGLPRIDLMIGGSPCQGFSINGNRLNFNDPRSRLLFKFVEFKNIIQPKNFLLENVATMSKDVKKAIDEYIGVEGIYLNSNCFSPQNRKRIYWTDIKFDSDIRPSGQTVGEILEEDHDSNLDLKKSMLERQYFYQETETDGVITLNPKMKSGRQTYQQDRIYCHSGRYVALTATLGNRFNIRDKNGCLRRLSIREQARLQTIPDFIKFDSVSDSSASHAIGNGWTIKAITHILKNIY